jgi:hypothetical protein
MKWQQFLQNDENKFSLSSLLKLMSFPFLTYVLLQQQTTEAMGIYGGLFVIDTTATKGINTYKKIQTTKIGARQNAVDNTNPSKK